MSSSSNQSDLDRSDADNALDDRLESLMADMEQELQRLNAADNPTPGETPDKELLTNTSTHTITNDSDEEDEDIEASAAQLMRDLNDALAEAEDKHGPDSLAASSNHTLSLQDQHRSPKAPDDLAALDESLAAGASTDHSITKDPNTSAPEPDELTAALIEDDTQTRAPATLEPNLPEPAVTSAPPRSHADQAAQPAATPPPTPPQPAQQAAVPPPSAQPAAHSTATDLPVAPETPPKPQAIPLTARIRSIALASARIISLPLAVLPPTVRDYIGWFGIITLINAGALWTFWLLFRA